MSLHPVLEYEEAVCHGTGGSQSLFVDGSDEPDSQTEARPGHASLKELNFRTVLTLWQKAARDSAGICLSADGQSSSARMPAQPSSSWSNDS
jgi:hypothetical protein